jgi:hypothetical protein
MWDHRARIITQVVRSSFGRATLVLGWALCFWAPGSANAADVALPTMQQVPPIKTYSTVLFGGVDDRTQNIYGYAGAIVALNGNIATDGFLFRTMGFYNPYNYSSTAVVGGNVDGVMTAFDVLFGYQKYFQGLTARLYAGLDYEGHRLTPDNPFDTNRGDAFGVHVRAELETTYGSTSPFYGSLLASYGSARERYWARGRVGYNSEGIIVGPEAIATGNPETYDNRVGAFITFRNVAPIELSISGGYSRTNPSRGGGSAYGTLELSAAF